MRTQRQLRVGEEIRHALATVLMRDAIPWPGGFQAPSPITVTEAEVSPDLRNANIFIMPLGGTQVQETVKAMNTIAGFFRHALARTVRLRYVPKLTFKHDTRFEYAQKIETILHKPDVAKDLEA